MWGELAPPMAPQERLCHGGVVAYFTVSRTALAAVTMLRREASTSG
jgi:hypothetical protein